MRNRIKEARQEAGFSQDGLAKALGTGRSTIVKLERGERPFTTEWMERISEALGCLPADLLAPDVSGVVWASPVCSRCLANGVFRVVSECDQHKMGNEQSLERIPVPTHIAGAGELYFHELDHTAHSGACAVFDPRVNGFEDKKSYLLLTEDGEIVVRRFTREDGPPRLYPLNGDGSTLYVGYANVKTLGRVVFIGYMT